MMVRMEIQILISVSRFPEYSVFVELSSFTCTQVAGRVRWNRRKYPTFNGIFMFFPFLHIPINMCCISWSLFAGSQHDNNKLLELNGYEQRPIAALIKSNIFLAQLRWGHSKTPKHRDSPKPWCSPHPKEMQHRKSCWLCKQTPPQ